MRLHLDFLTSLLWTVGHTTPSAIASFGTLTFETGVIWHRLSPTRAHLSRVESSQSTNCVNKNHAETQRMTEPATTCLACVVTCTAAAHGAQPSHGHGTARSSLTRGVMPQTQAIAQTPCSAVVVNNRGQVDSMTAPDETKKTIAIVGGINDTPQKHQVSNETECKSLLALLQAVALEEADTRCAILGHDEGLIVVDGVRPCGFPLHRCRCRHAPHQVKQMI